jgi:hypothetical protein
MEMVRIKEKDEMDKQARERLENGTLKTLRFCYKRLIEELEEIEECYNVSIYQVPQYPPNTKEAKDFFIQRT